MQREPDIQKLKRTVDELVRLMEDWARWNRGYKMKLGYPSFSAGLGCGGASQNFDEMVEAEDHKAFAIIDTIVSDLPPIQAAAVYRRYEIAAVFRFPRGNYEQALQDGHERLLIELERKGVMVI